MDKLRRVRRRGAFDGEGDGEAGLSILLELAVPLILAAVGIHALVSGADVFRRSAGARRRDLQRSGYAADVNSAVPGGVHAAHRVH